MTIEDIGAELLLGLFANVSQDQCARHYTRTNKPSKFN